MNKLLRTFTLICALLVMATGAWGAFPSTGILDLFNDTEGPPMTGWTDAYTGIKSNGTTAQANSATTNASYFNTAYGANVEGYVTITTIGTANSTNVICINTATFNGYGVAAETADGTYSIVRYDGGVGTAIDTGSHTWSNGDSVGLYVTTGGTVYSYYKTGAGAWTLMDTTADGTHTAQNYNIGIILFETTTRLDDFGGGTYVPPAAGALPVGYGIIMINE